MNRKVINSLLLDKTQVRYSKTGLNYKYSTVLFPKEHRDGKKNTLLESVLSQI